MRQAPDRMEGGRNGNPRRQSWGVWRLRRRAARCASVAAWLTTLVLSAATLPGGTAGAALQGAVALDGLGAVLAGESDGVGATASGRLFPAPASERFLAGEVAYVWSLVPDGEGGVFAATGSEGTVYHLSAGGEVERIAETLEYELFGLARDASGTLFFGGAPNGTVQRRTRDGEVTTAVDFPEGLVWDLLAAPDGALYASCGDDGEIYRIGADGAAQRIGRIPDQHVVALAWWNGRLLCGTDGRGLLVALDPETGAREVLFDTGQEEVVALLVRADDILFAANGEVAAEQENGGLTLPPIDVQAGGAGATARLYAWRPDGTVRVVWGARERHILALAPGPQGGTLVGTGDEGVLYHVDPRGNAVRLMTLEEADLLAVATFGDEVFVGTGNGGALYRLRWDARRSGSFTSAVHDAKTIVTWGEPHWVRSGTGEVTFETRSGRTSEPDETWAAWETWRRGPLTSPPGRFLQWRLTLAAAADGALAVGPLEIPYQGPNRPPRIEAVHVSAKAPAFVESGNSMPSAVRQELAGGVQVEYSLGEGNGTRGEIRRAGLWARTLRSATWRAQDPDGDRLRFDLYLRQLDEEGPWLPLEQDLEDAAWTWEAAAWPDGWYELKVVARDGRDNVSGAGLEGEELSEPFQIDNRPPEILDLRLQAEGDSLWIMGEARDASSRIALLEYSLDGAGWRLLLPQDGIFDSGRERFMLAVPRRDDGRRPAVIGVRAADEVGHLAADRLRLPHDGR